MNLFKEYGDKALSIKAKGKATTIPKNALQVTIALSDGKTKGKVNFTFDFADRFGSRVTCEVDFKDDLTMPTGGITTEDYQAVSSLTDYDDALDMFDEVVDDCVYEIGESAPFYATLIDECNWVLTDNNHFCSTLAVGFNPKTGKVDFYYNPEFILKGAMAQWLYASEDFRNFQDCYMYMLKYYMVHEMSHITRQHTVDNNSLLSGVAPMDVNIYGDSFINQVISTRILKETKKFYPVIGISNMVDKSGALNYGSDAPFSCVMVRLQDFIDKGLGLDFLNIGLIGDTVKKSSFFKALTKDEEIDCITAVYFGNYLAYSKADNSLNFINAVNDFFKKLITEKQMKDEDMQEQQDNMSEEQGNAQDEKTQSENKTNPDGGEALGNNAPKKQDNQPPKDNGQNSDSSKDPEQGSNNSDGGDGEESPQDSGGLGDDKGQGADGQGDSTDSKQNSDNADGEEGDASQGQSGENSDSSDSNNGEDNTQQNSNPSSDADKLKERQAMQDMLQKAVQKSNPDELASLLGQDALDLIGKTPSVQAWRKALRKAVSKVSGITEKWDANAVNARVEGELGREVEVPAMKSILITIDCSGSMGSVAFKKALEEISNLRKVVKGRLVVHVIYWGSSAVYKKYKLDEKLLPNLIRDGKDLGGTYFLTCIDEIIAKVKKPDLVIHCTDGEFFDDPETLRAGGRKIAKINKSSVWVLTPRHEKNPIKLVDPAFAKRVVVMGK